MPQAASDRHGVAHGASAMRHSEIRRVGDPADFSPLELVASHQPPTLLVHAARDEYCALVDALVKWGWVRQSR